MENFRRQILKRNTRNLRDYDALVSLESADPISRLSLLTGKEVASVLDRLSVEQLVGISSYIDGNLLLKYVKQTSEQRKVQLLQRLNRPNEMNEAELETIKQELAYYVDELATRIFSPKAEREMLNEAILKNSENSKELIEVFKEEDPSFYRRYKRYALSFDDFLKDASDAARRTMDKVDNDTLAVALQKISPPQQQRLLSGLNENRKQIILSGIGSKLGNLDDEDIKVEREKLLDTYRSFANVDDVTETPVPGAPVPGVAPAPAPGA